MKMGNLLTIVGIFITTNAGIWAAGRPVDALLANAGRGLGHAFLDQDLNEALKVIHTNIVVKLQKLIRHYF